jgi:hypothetical protein
VAGGPPEGGEAKLYAMPNPVAFLSDHLSEEEFAAEIKHTLRTVQRWRALRIGPDPTWIGRRVYYSPETIRRWLENGGSGGHPRDRKRGRRS